ncbi:MAG TPA: alcohol dehydrogenase catalytic domain-containing protein [Terriglobia bacterium]|nr:alcohol dehydrogenase catalytic domain-containing protein [Terriglobia bacterium]
MWAGVYRGQGRVVAEEVPVPEISAGEVLVRVHACGICGTDVKKIKHGFLPPPQIFGHEIAGTVEAVGEGVHNWRPGDRVVAFHHIPCGGCFYCEQKLFSQCPNYKKVGVTSGFRPSGGGFAEYVRVMDWIAERGMVAIPPGVSFEEAIFVEPVNTCLKAIYKARIQPQETVLVIGQGPIGMLLLLLARLHGGARVLSTDPMPARREKSLELGAEESFDPAAGDLVEELRGLTSGRGADVVLVAAPQRELLEQALALARPGGRILLFAYNDPLLRVEFPAATVGIDEKEILGSYSSSFDLQDESARLVFERVLPVRDLISHRFPLSQVEQALNLAAHPSEESLKIILVP